jgi:hypothetical protein
MAIVIACVSVIFVRVPLLEIICQMPQCPDGSAFGAPCLSLISVGLLPTWRDRSSG